jgi:MraZ protein
LLDLHGEYSITVDTKNRFLLPNALRTQYPEAEKNAFYINRSAEQCLQIYSISEWKIMASYVAKLNPFSTKARTFKRLFRSGASLIELDASGRLLIPKEFLLYAGITKDATLTTMGNYVELWDTITWSNYNSEHRASFSDLGDEMASGDYLNPFDKD